jgi:hypothetical protein
MKIWIVEKKKTGSDRWVPHESYDWFDTKREARRVSSRDAEMRTVCYERRE